VNNLREVVIANWTCSRVIGNLMSEPLCHYVTLKSFCEFLPCDIIATACPNVLSSENCLTYQTFHLPAASFLTRDIFAKIW